MKPTIILDKSALQSLSRDELVVLHKYYHVLVLPVLLLEVLGDLKKAFNDKTSSKAVIELANKVLQFSSTVNTHYSILALDSLFGQPVALDRRIDIAHGRWVRTPEGECGVIIEESIEEQALRRWKDGNFRAFEEVLADRWRSATHKINLENLRNRLRKSQPAPLADSLESYARMIDKPLSSPSEKHAAMTMLAEFLCQDVQTAQSVFWQWEGENSPVPSEYAPYASYCFKVIMLFVFALHKDLIGTRPTNYVDMEYLYYLPFCDVFCSADCEQSSLAKVLLRHDQKFVDRDILKNDLKNIALKVLDKEGDTGSGPARHIYPPNDGESITFQLWKGLGFLRDAPAAKPTEPPSPEMREKLKKFEKAIIDHIESKRKESIPIAGGAPMSGKPDFIIVERFDRANDPCPCGSGKILSECHGKPRE